jgi:DNA damage-binding protein 1
MLRYLLCGLGDGQLLNWHITPGAAASTSISGPMLTDRKAMVLGTKPILLRAYRAAAATHVLAASDRPTVIYSNNRKLLYSNLNENEVRSPRHVKGYSRES